MAKIKVFLDTDVLVSSLLSKKGASYEIINYHKISKLITPAIKRELEEVSKRLHIKNLMTQKLVDMLKLKRVGLTKDEIIKKYGSFVLDIDDSHVVAGANVSKSKFLLTYNLKHYNIDKIKRKFGIIVIKPGNFLQYLRSKS